MPEPRPLWESVEYNPDDAPTFSSVFGSSEASNPFELDANYWNVNKGSQLDSSALTKVAQGGFMNPNKSWYENILPSTGTDGSQWSGFGGPVLQLGTGLANAYTGWQNMKQNKEKLAFQKQVWSDQFNIQKKMTNTQLSDRQAARVASGNPNTLSVDAYMKLHGL